MFVSKQRIPLYAHSYDYALKICEAPLSRQSHAENLRCVDAIEDAISKDFNANHLDSECAKKVIDEFGYDRVNFILQCSLKQSKKDTRFSDSNREWASKAFIPESNMRKEYQLLSHPVLVNGFVDQARNEWNKLNLWDASHCVESDAPLDYEGKCLVLRPQVLKDDFKNSRDQLFIATSGFGCSPTASGRSVSGYFPSDDEHCTWYRQDFIGILKDEHIPDFVKEKLEETNSATDQEQVGGMSMS